MDKDDTVVQVGSEVIDLNAANFEFIVEPSIDGLAYSNMI